MVCYSIDTRQEDDLRKSNGYNKVLVNGGSFRGQRSLEGKIILPFDKIFKKIRCCFNKVIIQYNKFYLTRATLITIVVLPLVAQIALEQSLVILRSRKTMLWSLSLHIGVL